MATPKKEEYIDNTAYTLPENKFTRLGYEFTDWKVQRSDGQWMANKDGTVGGDEAKAVVLKNKEVIDYTSWSDKNKGVSFTLYAQWKPKSYVVKLNNGTWRTIEYNTEFNLPGGAVYYALSRSDGKVDVSGSNSPAPWYDKIEAEKNGYGLKKHPQGQSLKLDESWLSHYDKAEDPKFDLTAYYGVKYDTYGGNGENEVVYKRHGEDLTIKNLTREGYTLDHWCTEPWAKTSSHLFMAKYEPGEVYNKNESIVLYAHWKKNSPAAKTYTVTYNANGGTGAPAKQTKTEDVNLTLSKTEPTRDGYVFDHWCTNSACTNGVFSHLGAASRYAPGATYKKDEALSLYAIWDKVDTYTVTYNPNGGNFDKGTDLRSGVLVEPGTRLDALPTPFRDGYDFVGWYTAPTGGTKIYIGTTVTEDVIYYAHWKVAPAKQDDYMLLSNCSYYPSYGTVKLNKRANIYSMPGGGSTKLTALTTLPKDTLLHVTGLYENGAGKYWYSVDWSFGSLSLSGYVYAGHTYNYQCGPLLDDVRVDNLRLPQNHTQGKSYSLGGKIHSELLYLNEISGSIEDSAGNRYSKVLRSGNDKKLTSFDLRNSAIDKALKFGKLQTGNCRYVITVSADYYYSTDGTTLKSWRQTEDLFWHDFKVVKVAPKDKTVRFISDDKVVYSRTMTSTNNNLTILSQPYDKPGYVFRGWNAFRDSAGKWYTNKGWQTQNSIDKNGYTKKLYRAGESQNLYHSSWETGNITFYAVWEKLPTYAISYDANGGAGAPAQQEKLKGTGLALSGAVPTRDGFDFLGWATTNTATAPEYQPGDVYTEDAPLTLYAVWKAKVACTVTFDANSGSGLTESLTANSGDSITLDLMAPSYAGHKLLGWATSGSAATPEYQFGASYTVS